jgi:hypothetical protein
MMGYTCGVCGNRVEGGVIALSGHTEGHIVDLIKKKHPDWQEEEGICQRCLDYYRRQMRGN